MPSRATRRSGTVSTPWPPIRHRPARAAVVSRSCIVYGPPRECRDYYFSYAGPETVRVFGRSEPKTTAASPEPEKFRCTQCEHRWPTDVRLRSESPVHLGALGGCGRGRSGVRMRDLFAVVVWWLWKGRKQVRRDERPVRRGGLADAGGAETRIAIVPEETSAATAAGRAERCGPRGGIVSENNRPLCEA